MALAPMCWAGAARAQTAAAAPAAPAASAPAGPSVRPELSKPLQETQELLRAKDGKGAMAKLAEAEAVPGTTPYEAYVISRFKAVAANEVGDLALALAQFEKALGSEFLPEADRLLLIGITGRMSVQAKDYPRAVTWLTRYKQAGGTDDLLRRLLPQVLAETGDHAASARESLLLVQADQAAGRVSLEAVLRNLAFSQNKIGDEPGYVLTIERLAQHYPQPSYWADLISRVERKPGFDSNRLRLDVYRLMRATGSVLQADELADMAQQAQSAGLPAEAQALLDEGYAAGLLGKGKDAPAQQNLRAQATRAAAQDRATLADQEKSALANKDGNAAVNLGFALSGAGLHEPAVALMEQGLAKGGLRRPDEGQLHLAVAQWRAGKLAPALRSFAEVKGSDGSAGLARLWALLLNSAKKP